MKKIKLWLISSMVILPLLPGTSAFGQTLEWIRNPVYQIKYQVPANWTHIKESNDTITLMTHMSPEGDMMLLVGKLKGAALQVSPQQALEGLLHNFGVPGNRVFQTRYNGIRFLETTGSGTLTNPQTAAPFPVHYDAMAANHQGHVILVYVYATTNAYALHRPLLETAFRSIAPYRGK